MSFINRAPTRTNEEKSRSLDDAKGKVLALADLYDLEKTSGGSNIEAYSSKRGYIKTILGLEDEYKVIRNNDEIIYDPDEIDMKCLEDIEKRLLE